MKFLLLVLISSVSFAQERVPEVCVDDPKKGACLIYEDKSPVRNELPKDLSYSSFYKVIIRTPMSHRSFKGADLQEAEFLNNKAIQCDFTSAKMKGFRARGSDFFRSRFKDVDLRAAKLFYANLRESDLRNALLADSDLSFADLRKADLRGADLQGVWILGALFTGAIYDKKTRLPFSQQQAQQLGMILDDKTLEKTH